MTHIIINPSLSAAIGYNFFYPPKFAVVIVILEPTNSTRTDNRHIRKVNYVKIKGIPFVIDLSNIFTIYYIQGC